MPFHCGMLDNIPTLKIQSLRDLMSLLTISFHCHHILHSTSPQRLLYKNRERSLMTHQTQQVACGTEHDKIINVLQTVQKCRGLKGADHQQMLICNTEVKVATPLDPGCFLVSLTF